MRRPCGSCCASGALLLCASMLASLGGCQAKEVSGVGPYGVPRGEAATRPGTSTAGAPAAKRVLDTHVAIEILPVGLVPYDNLMLPIVDPAGRYVATQVGAPPDWPTILGTPTDNSPPLRSRLEIYALDPQRRSIELATVADTSAILGRSASEDGFLVEAPQQDGSRWIGLVAWRTGSVEWLVQDESVNAFAHLSDAGDLAWSRLNESGEFDLVVRRGGEEFTLDGPGDWMAPMWSGHGADLFVINHTNGYVDLVFGRATDAETFQRTRKMLPLAIESNRLVAFQTLAGGAASPGGSPSWPSAIIFYHPGNQRVCLWRPEIDKSTGVLLDRESIAGARDGENFVLVAMENALLRRSLLDLGHRSELVTGHLYLPRQVRHDYFHFLLLTPANGEIGLTFMRELPAGR